MELSLRDDLGFFFMVVYVLMFPAFRFAKGFVASMGHLQRRAHLGLGRGAEPTSLSPPPDQNTTARSTPSPSPGAVCLQGLLAVWEPGEKG